MLAQNLRHRNPRLPSFRIATICDSLNFDFFIGPSRAPGQNILPEKSTFICLPGGGAYGEFSRRLTAMWVVVKAQARAGETRCTFARGA